MFCLALLLTLFSDTWTESSLRGELLPSLGIRLNKLASLVLVLGDKSWRFLSSSTPSIMSSPSLGSKDDTDLTTSQTWDTLIKDDLCTHLLTGEAEMTVCDEEPSWTWELELVLLDDSSSDDMVELQSDPTVILDSGLSVRCEIFFKLLY